MTTPTDLKEHHVAALDSLLRSTTIQRNRLREALDQREEELRAARERIRLLEIQKGAAIEQLSTVLHFSNLALSQLQS